MKRGVKPTPTAIKELHGSLRKSRKVNEPVAPAGALVPTSQIDCSPYAREIWDHYMATAPWGMLKPVDAPLLERLCIALSMAREAQEQVQVLGLVVTTGGKKDANGNVIVPGSPIQNPFLSVVNRQSEIARKLAAELGLPVTARARIDMPTDPPPPDPSTGVSRPRPETFDAFLSSNPQGRPN